MLFNSFGAHILDVAHTFCLLFPLLWCLVGTATVSSEMSYITCILYVNPSIDCSMNKCLTKNMLNTALDN